MSTQLAPVINVPRGMSALVGTAPALFLPNEKAAERFFDFFASNIRNKNTRRAYYKAVCRFADWCEGRGVHQLAHVKPLHVAAFIEALPLAKPTVKQHLAAIRMLFDSLVIGHAIDVNPAHAVRGPSHVVKKGRTPVLDREDPRMRDSIK
jgi:site-specific recombinase XerD